MRKKRGEKASEKERKGERATSQPKDFLSLFSRSDLLVWMSVPKWFYSSRQFGNKVEKVNTAKMIGQLEILFNKDTKDNLTCLELRSN